MRAELVEIAFEASEKLLELVRTRDLDAKAKADGSPVTAADIAINAFLTVALADQWDYPIVAEESAAASYEERRTWKRLWLVDPLDGTKDFIAGTGDYTVNVALIEDGRPILGVIAAPGSGTVWSGAEGDGAYKHTSAGHEVRISNQRGDGPFVALESRFHRDAQLTEFYQRYGVVEAKTFGSAVKFAKLAEGEADVYARFGRTMEWDVAAGHAIVAAAGCTIVSTTGEPLRYNKRELENPGFIASTKRFASILRSSAPIDPAR